MNKLELSNQDLKSALSYARFQKNRYFKQQQDAQSELVASLDKLSSLNEDNIHKTQLRDLMNLIFKYCKAHNLYTYFREDVTRLLLKIGDNEDGNFNDTNK